MYVLTCVCMCWYVCAIVCIWRVKDNLPEPIASIYMRVPRMELRSSVKIDDKNFYPSEASCWSLYTSLREFDEMGQNNQGNSVPLMVNWGHLLPHPPPSCFSTPGLATPLFSLSPSPLLESAVLGLFSYKLTLPHLFFFFFIFFLVPRKGN